MSERHDSISEPESQQVGDASMDEKRVFCAECNSSFRTMNWLIRHDLQCHPRSYDINIVQGDNPLKCSYCPAAFNFKWNRIEHEKRCCRNVHLFPQLNPEKPLPVKKVFKASIEKPLLVKKALKAPLEKPPLKKKVLMAHSLPQLNQEKPPRKRKIRQSKSKTCVESCQQRIISNPKSTMNKMNLTPGGVPFEYANKLHCSYCPKLLLSFSGKAIHEKMHTGETPYQCKFCQTTFRLQCNLNAHERKCNELVDEVWCQFCDFHSKSFSTVEYHCRKVHRVFDLNRNEMYSKEEHSSDGTLYSESIKCEEFSDEEVPTKIQNIPIAIKSEPAYYWSQSFMIDYDDDDED